MVALSPDAADVPSLMANVPRQVADGIGFAAGQAVAVSVPAAALRVLG
jgi:hypothetical protein